MYKTLRSIISSYQPVPTAEGQQAPADQASLQAQGADQEAPARPALVQVHAAPRGHGRVAEVAPSKSTHEVSRWRTMPLPRGSAECVCLQQIAKKLLVVRAFGGQNQQHRAQEYVTGLRRYSAATGTPESGTSIHGPASAGSSADSVIRACAGSRASIE